jgi:hypothetical protein
MDLIVQAAVLYVLLLRSAPRVTPDNKKIEFPDSGGFAGMVCFEAALIGKLLAAYCITPDRNITFSDMIDGKSVSWTLGAIYDTINHVISNV